MSAFLFQEATDSSTTTDSGAFSTTESGNSITGRYSCTTTGTDNATITDVATDQTATDTSTTHRQQHLHHHGQRQPHFHIVQQRHQPDRSGDDP